jgi:glycerol-3-phosphate acyltransferase PlsY
MIKDVAGLVPGAYKGRGKGNLDKRPQMHTFSDVIATTFGHRLSSYCDFDSGQAIASWLTYATLMCWCTWWTLPGGPTETGML